MTRKTFAQLAVGDSADLAHTITAEDVAAFVRLTGDDNPLHLDPDFAATTDLRKPVSHGMLTASFVSTLIGTKLPGPGALWYEADFRFVAPVHVGETIVVTATVRHKTESLRLLALDIAVATKDGRKVLAGTAGVQCMADKTSAAGEGGVRISAPAADAAERPGKDTGRAVIVSGGGRGIGSAISRALAKDGYPVVLNFLHDRAAAETTVRAIAAGGGQARAIEGDIADPAVAARLVAVARDVFGGLAGIVNNAAPPPMPTPFAEIGWDTVQRHIDVQVKGAFCLTQAALPVLAAAGGGCVVSVATTGLAGVPPAGLGAYLMAKAAVVALSKSVAAEYGPQNIRANCVAPGMTETDMIAAFPEKAKMLVRATTPLRRLANPEDVADSVAFLFSPRARHISGEIIRVCGGQVM